MLLSQPLVVPQYVTEPSSRIRLVDLAGSERLKATEATGARLREGSNIDKSLMTLGRVITALADPKALRSGERCGFLPCRESILTWFQMLQKPFVVAELVIVYVRLDLIPLPVRALPRTSSLVSCGLLDSPCLGAESILKTT